MLNRSKRPWMGCWNGIGGKLNDHETKEECIRREIMEETGLDGVNVVFKGILTWNNFDAKGNGLYLFAAYLDENVSTNQATPTSEGILSWKEFDWIIEEDNIGVAKNIRYFLPWLFEKETLVHCHCEFEGYNLLEVTMKEMDDE